MDIDDFRGLRGIGGERRERVRGSGFLSKISKVFVDLGGEGRKENVG